MSWFDAAGLANIAKSALKEAQKTIDKALDIKEDNGTTIVPTNTPIDTNPDDFFNTWGITETGNVSKQSNKLASSIWGSFTGSFFDNSSKEMSVDNLDDISTEDFANSKLVVVEHEESINSPDGTSPDDDDLDRSGGLVEVSLSEDYSNPIHAVKRREKPSSSPLINRLSIVSTESGKNSSESVDIITCNTDECTTTPESELISTSSSALGTKQISDSVEILGDSLTSPSSVEVLGTNSTNSRRQSQHTDAEFSSPCSPWIEQKPLMSPEEKSPDSVEVIPEDQDENSVAEDTMSYTSISESNSVTVMDSATINFSNNLMHLKPQKMLKDTFNNRVSIDAGESFGGNEPNCSDKNFEAITRAPSRTAMHLPLPQVNQLIDTQPLSNSHQDITNILQKTNVIDIPQEDEEIARSFGSETTLLDTSTDEGSQSDKTLIGANDNLMDCCSDTSTTTERSGNSTYLKNLLADAMVEKSPDHSLCLIPNTKEPLLDDQKIITVSDSLRPNSPLSSESRSDLVKIGSDHTSCHTSCDELETTTSSDIEIISSPNGDSSSTQSRQSPSKHTLHYKPKSEESTIDSLLQKMTIKKAKGHNRELSEASSMSDDSHPIPEVDRLLKRISEMTEILESRESKLIDMNRRHVELQELNSDLKQHLDSVLSKQLESADVTQVTEEYTQRLSALEKKFQQAIRDKDALRKQLEQAKIDAATRLSKGEFDATIAEKDEIIKELREEGEKLSQTQLKHSNIIKKLRVKEKENESTIKSLRDNIESLSTDSERLKKSLSAKEDVERTQIEAVHQLTTKNKKLEQELAKIKSNLDDTTQKYETTRKSLEAAKKELVDKQKTSSDLLAREQMLETLENQKRMTESQNEEVINQLEDLRCKLDNADQEYVNKEQKLRRENSELLRRLEEVEERNEELSQAVLEVNKPLVRQLESLQASYNAKVVHFEKVEQELSLKIGELQSKLQNSLSSERSTKEECIKLKTKLADLEGRFSSTNHELDMVKMQLDQISTERHLVEHEHKSKIEDLTAALRKSDDLVLNKDKEIEQLNQQLELERASIESERKRIAALQEVVASDKSDNHHNVGTVERTSPTSRSNSPTLSLGKVSVSESMGSSFWSPDAEQFDVSQTPRYTNMFEMQILQSNLKQREGELQQLQWELNRREQERALLNSEISSLLTKIEELETLTSDYGKNKEELEELQRQYDTLCQLFGEKVEENEELKLDLIDVKEMYKSQIDELLRQQREAK